MNTPISRAAGGCDCHVHIYAQGFPMLERVAWVPRHSPVSRYVDEVARPLGLSHAVLVQPTAYGFDNGCLLDALDRFEGRARGIALLDPGASNERFESLHARGVRGVRYMLMQGVLDWTSLPAMSRRVADHGWMIDLQFDGRTAPDHEDLIRSLACKVVIDHTGKFLEPVAPTDARFQSLLRILESGRVWIKLSAPYETSRRGPPDYDDVGVLAQALAQRFPERCLWGSNWPHPSQEPEPASGPLLRWLERWVPDDKVRRKVLVDNPRVLFEFDADAGV